MSAEEENPTANDEESLNKGKKSAKYDSGAADLEKVTDYVEEAEISHQDIGEVINKFTKFFSKRDNSFIPHPLALN